jgi:N-acetylglutamate synthase-like GNAT family acetyltransferase
MDFDYTEEIAAKEVWVAEAEGEIVGALVMRWEPDHVFIDNVAVDPAQQGGGVGRELLEETDRRDEQGFSRVYFRKPVPG